MQQPHLPQPPPTPGSAPLTSAQRRSLQRMVTLALLGAAAGLVILVGAIALIITRKTMESLIGVLAGPLMIGFAIYRAEQVCADLRLNYAIVEDVWLGHVGFTTGSGGRKYAIFDDRLHFRLTPQQYTALQPFSGYRYRISYTPKHGCCCLPSRYRHSNVLSRFMIRHEPAGWLPSPRTCR